MSTAALIGLAAAGVAVLLFLILVLRLQAFIALLVVSILVALAGGIPAGEVADAIAAGVGSTLGYIAVVVGVGAMFGEMLHISGGAERIAGTLVARFGQRRTPAALGLTGVLVAIPVFFDVALILLIPLVYSLSHATGRSLLHYGIPLAAGLAVGHAFIPPTPGPVAVAAILGADLGWVILFGMLAGIPSMVVGGLLYGRFIAERIHLAVPEHPAARPPGPDEDGAAPLPGFGLVMLLLALPLSLILLNTAGRTLLPEESPLRGWLGLVGHPFVALILAALLAFYLLGVRRGYSGAEVQRIATRALEPVGVVILVTGAGGAFGKVLVATGVGDAVAGVMAGSPLPLVVLAFSLALGVRVAQGSATVSMVTAAGLIAPVLESGMVSDIDRALLTVAIAAGATALSHVNDSGFWLISRFFGMTTEQTLRTWTVVATLVGGVGFAVVLLISLLV